LVCRIGLRVVQRLDSAMAGLHRMASPLIVDVLDQGKFPSHAVAAYAGDEPVGLAIGFGAPNGQVELASLFVSPFFRRQGIGRALLTAIEAEFIRRGFTLGGCSLSLAPNDLSRTRFLRACGWGRPSIKSIRFRSTMTLAMQAPWFVSARLPPGYSIVPWATVTDAQRDELRVSHFFTPGEDVDPFAIEEDCEPRTSLALLKDPVAPGGTPAIAGWTINHAVDERTLRWTASWVNPVSQKLGLVVPLWLETARRQAALTPFTDFVFTAPVTKPRMARFVERRMQPWSRELVYSCTVLKPLALTGA